jgi:hypothetical protein
MLCQVLYILVSIIALRAVVSMGSSGPISRGGTGFKLVQKRGNYKLPKSKKEFDIFV